MRFDALPRVADRTIRPSLNPLGTVQLRGAIRRGLSSRDNQVRYVDVDYTASWTCAFFGLTDCLLISWRMTSVRVGSDGRFSAALPDFAHDAAVNAFKRPGEFAFVIRDRKSGNRLFELRPAGSGSYLGVPVASDYGQLHTFDAEPAK